MKAIQTQEVSGDSHLDTVHREYRLKIGDQWFKLSWDETSVLDGRHACSSNILKWDCVGMNNKFKIEQSEDPEQELPDDAMKFIARFQETGKTEGTLMNLHPNMDRDYPGHLGGWIEERFKHEYVC